MITITENNYSKAVLDVTAGKTNGFIDTGVGSECGDTFLLIISWCMECHLSPVGQFSQVHRVF
jgi:hypothetical protein